MLLSPIGLTLDDIKITIQEALDNRLKSAEHILDGVALEELVNFAVPLTSQQTPDQIHDGVLLGYKGGKLVEEPDLNGGSF
jgi:hypothetical protein